MWSIRVLKDEAVPVGHSASCTHPRAHLVLRKLQQNAAINKSPSGFCLEDPIVTAPTTAACVPCKSTERLCYSLQFEVCGAWVSFFCLDFCIYEINVTWYWDFFNFFFCLLIFHRYIIKKKKTSNKDFQDWCSVTHLHMCTASPIAVS